MKERIRRMDLNTKRIQKAMRASIAAKNPEFKALWSKIALALMAGDATPVSRYVN
jgi:hypothetical protein